MSIVFWISSTPTLNYCLRHGFNMTRNKSKIMLVSCTDWIPFSLLGASCKKMSDVGVEARCFPGCHLPWSTIILVSCDKPAWTCRPQPPRTTEYYITQQTLKRYYTISLKSISIDEAFSCPLWRTSHFKMYGDSFMNDSCQFSETNIQLSDLAGEWSWVPWCTSGAHHGQFQLIFEDNYNSSSWHGVLNATLHASLGSVDLFQEVFVWCNYYLPH